MADNRFETVYFQSSGIVTFTQIIVDKETGVNYLWHKDGNSGGLTPLIDKDGNPVVTPIENK